MKPDDKDKLNKCLEILDTTDLGLSLVWLWTWSTAKGFLENSEWVANITEDQLWEYLCKAVKDGMGFSLEFGAEDHYEGVKEWMFTSDFISEAEYEDED